MLDIGILPTSPELECRHRFLATSKKPKFVMLVGSLRANLEFFLRHRSVNF